jgi:hypothetical protein
MKTKTEIKNIVRLLTNEIARLPARNAFGDSNAGAIAEMTEWLEDLERGRPFRSDEVKAWDAGKFSALSDFA